MTKARESYLMRTYGITEAEFKAIFKFQKGLCAICGRDLLRARIETDHEHGGVKGDKAMVRGLLCGGRYAGCNRKLGRIDNFKWLCAAKDYIEDPPARRYFRELKEKSLAK